MLTPIPVFLYHCVKDDDDAVFTVTPEVYRQHVKMIAESGRTSLTLTELASALRREREMPDAPVCLTFDDGYADSFETIESAAALGVKSSLFVTTGKVDAPGAVTTPDLVSLAAMTEHVELGAHTVVHPRLDELRRDDALHEITGSRAALAETIGREVRSFAYPHGAHSGSVRQQVIDAGFDAAAAVKNAFSHPGDDPWAIARVTITRNTPETQVAALLRGEGAPLAWRRERFATRSYRLTRIAGRRFAEIRSGG